MSISSDNIKHIKTARFWLEKLIPVMREDLLKPLHRDEALRILSNMSHELLLSDSTRFESGAVVDKSEADIRREDAAKWAREVAILLEKGESLKARRRLYTAWCIADILADEEKSDD